MPSEANTEGSPSAKPTPLVIAVVGMSGSGKSEVVQLISDIVGGEIVYFGGVVIEEIERQGRVVTEESESEIRMALRKQHGMEAMAKLCMPRINEAVSRNLTVIVDGLYSYSEYLFLKNALGDNLVTLAVHSPFYLRIARLANRPVRPLSALEIHRRDKREVETMEKGGPIALADFHLINDGSLADLGDQLKQKVLCRLSPSWGTQ